MTDKEKKAAKQKRYYERNKARLLAGHKARLKAERELDEVPFTTIDKIDGLKSRGMSDEDCAKTLGVHVIVIKAYKPGGNYA